MLVNSNNYNRLLQEFREEDKNLVESLINLFYSLNMFHVPLASVGNSIASGYSKCDDMLPLLARSSIYEKTDMFDLYNFARVRRNEERKIIQWYKSNISHGEINKLLIDDILAKVGKYASFSNQNLKVYEKMRDRTDMGFMDFVKLDNNIIIYNGLTGSFTDRIRKGNFQDRLKLFSGFIDDFENLKSLLYQFYLDNPGMQVYICGIPDFLGIGISNKFDRYIINAIKDVPNARYIPGSSRNVFSKLSGQKEFDIHYSVPEYLNLLNRVYKEILKSYIPLKIKNSMLNKIALYSAQNEDFSTTSMGSSTDIEQIINDVLGEYEEIISKNNIDVDAILEEVWNFYNTNYLLLFPCTDRIGMKKIIKCKLNHQ